MAWSDLQIFLIQITNQNAKGFDIYIKEVLSGVGYMLHAQLTLQNQFTVDHLSFQSWLLESQGEHRTLAMYVLDLHFIIFIVRRQLSYL